MSMPMDSLINGYFIRSIVEQLDQSLGDFWYIAVFFTQWFVVYIKTQSLMLPTIITLWTIALFGQLMPYTWVAKMGSAAIWLGLVAVVMWALSPFLRK